MFCWRDLCNEVFENFHSKHKFCYLRKRQYFMHIKPVLAKTLSKIQITAIFLKQDMRRNVLPKFIEICMKTPYWCPPGWVLTWRPETNRNICH